MAKNRYPHLFLRGRQQTLPYRAPPRPLKRRVPERDRAAQAAKLQRQLEEAWTQARRLEIERSAVSLPARGGAYLEFQGSAGYELVLKGVEDLRSKRIRLCSVRQVAAPEGEDQTVATVYVPDEKKGYFLRKISEYAAEETGKGNPRHNDLVRSIEAIRLAVYHGTGG